MIIIWSRLITWNTWNYIIVNKLLILGRNI